MSFAWTRAPGNTSRAWNNEPMAQDRSTALTREKVLQILRDHYPYLATKYGVRRIGLFGSYAKGKARGTSDIDLIVEFERPIGFQFVELVEYLENVLGASVDVLTPAGVEGIRHAHIREDIQEFTIYV